MSRPEVISSTPSIYRAKWLVPVAGPPLENGRIAVQGRKIVAVGQEHQFPAKVREAREVDLGDVVLFPAFVNAHTHLEFSRLERPLAAAGTSFESWIAAVVAWRREQAAAGTGLLDRSGERVADPESDWRPDSIRQGWRECYDRGTAAVGEIFTPPGLASFWQMQPGQGVVFLEMLGFRREHHARLLQVARELERTWPRSSSWQLGLSPHAPYTVAPALLTALCELAQLRQLPIAMHLAETREELELIETRQGSLVRRLEALEAWDPDAIAAGTRIRDYLQTLARAPRSLVVHGNYLAPGDWSWLARHRSRMSVIYCPRTHDFFGHDPYPLAAMLDAGVAVGIGTDSRASNPDLSVLGELRHVRRHHSALEPWRILQLGTLDSARALGLHSQLGTLQSGKQAALLTLPCGAGCDPWEVLLESDETPTRL